MIQASQSREVYPMHSETARMEEEQQKRIKRAHAEMDGYFWHQWADGSADVLTISGKEYRVSSEDCKCEDSKICKALGIFCKHQIVFNIRFKVQTATRASLNINLDF